MVSLYSRHQVVHVAGREDGAPYLLEDVAPYPSIKGLPVHRDRYGTVFS